MTPAPRTRAIPPLLIRLPRRIKPSLAAFFLLLSFWFLTALHLDRYPMNHPDEGWILSPGYKLLTHGSFGTSLFAGYYGAEQHLFDFMPLFAIVQGLAALVLGITSFTVRFTNLGLGMVLLALVYALAREWFNRRVGIVAVALNLMWVWGTGFSPSNPIFIPLMSTARIARYDVLAAVLSVAACWTFIRGVRTTDLRFFGVTGFLLGLACLTHLYCVFWLPVFGGVLALHRIRGGRSFLWREAMVLGAGFLMPCLMWFGYMLLNWNDYVGQARENAHSFDFLNVQFYLHNLRSEAARYIQVSFFSNPLSYPGLIIAFVTLPMAWFSLARQALRRHDPARLVLLLATALIPLSFALFIDRKFRYYLIAFVPLQTILMAWYLHQLADAPKFALRLFAAFLLVAALGTGVVELTRMHYFAQSRRPIDSYLRQVEDLTPPGTRILGPVEYWLAFPKRDYRAFNLVEYLTLPLTYEKPLEPLDAFAVVAPEVVLLDARYNFLFASTRTPELEARGIAFWDYMRAHNARRVATMTDPEGAPLEIYTLEQ